MNKIIEKTANSAMEIYSKFNSVSQAKTKKSEISDPISDEMPALVRRAAAQGAVLMKNDGVLPLKDGCRVSLFGRVQQNWFYTGYGSGGEVNRPYEVNLADGIRNCEKLKLNEKLANKYERWCAENKINDSVWGMWPRFYPEMPIEASEIFEASKESDCAVVVIGRSSGEDRDCSLEKGSYYLTDDELCLLGCVTDYFSKTVVLLNIGCMMDLKWAEKFGDKINALLILWQGGMESGNAAADILCGKENPSGKLTDTAAAEYEDYPSAKDFANVEFNNYTDDIYVGYRYFETFEKEKVLYPFGFGLSYTQFSIKCESAEPAENGFSFNVTVTNTGERSGREVVQLYIQKPCTVLGNPARELAAFAKTDELKPNESQTLNLFVSMYQLSSYDSEGKSGFKSAYVTEGGLYRFYLGTDVRSAEEVYTFYEEETKLYEQLSECLAPENSFEVITAVEGINGFIPVKRKCPERQTNLAQRIMKNLPSQKERSDKNNITLYDVASGNATMDEFISTLSLDELEAITRGDYTMDSPLGAKGNAGALGGVLPSLREKGVSAAITTDGPSGIRLEACCSLIPIGTLLACTFDEKLVEEVYSAIAREMKERGSHILLAPGMNIHRNPLCGRNFEYYSEDPLVTGKIAAAAVKGIQSCNGSACPKHFACNNQEFKRTVNDSRVSERALRQIYLKGFEICIKEAEPKNIMTSYNKVNGVYSYYNYDLCTSVLRNEWGYKGNVMTDWWNKKGKSPDFPSVYDQAYRIRAQVDVLMPGGKRTGKRKPDGTLLKSLRDRNGITFAEIQRSAENVLNFIINSAPFADEK